MSESNLVSGNIEMIRNIVKHCHHGCGDDRDADDMDDLVADLQHWYTRLLWQVPYEMKVQPKLLNFFCSTIYLSINTLQDSNLCLCGGGIFMFTLNPYSHHNGVKRDAFLFKFQFKNVRGLLQLLQPPNHLPPSLPPRTTENGRGERNRPQEQACLISAPQDPRHL